ncbi:MAG: HAMP domain-containing histidine kinase [Lachnospiraceae bacterium]|nr:HAMP domain-containing histidine kinase [Lachnospiraceae bacterium]
MKATLKTSSFAWKSYALISGISVLFIFICGFLGFSLLRTQYALELNQYGNIAGAVLSEYPDAEQTLLSAMQDKNYSHLDKGFSILEKYGYRENTLMTDIPYYHSHLVSFFSLLAMFLVVDLILSVLCYFFFYKAYRAQEQRLHEMLECYLADNYSLLADKENLAPVFSESFTDTLLKLGHRLMAKTQALAKERDHTKTLVTDISHQLKTPVSALKNCFAMCMETDSEVERADFLERCAGQISHLENLLTELVNISRLETSMITLKQENVLLSDVLADAVTAIYEKTLPKNITIELLDPDGENASCTSLFLDRHWTAEAIANLLDNAVKYSPPDSAVTLRLHRFYSYISLEVEDEGIGISKEEANRIFKRFYRGNHPTVKQTEGAGVGLYLTRRILEEQGGTISVKSAGGRGSIFTVHLPLPEFV